MFALTLTTLLLRAGLAAAPATDTVAVTFVNRVAIDIAAPASLIWGYLPSIQNRPGMEKVLLNGIADQYGSRFDNIYRDSTGKITRHDRVEILEWKPGVRYVALVNYLPPAEPITIIYNVDLAERNGVTHFVMDSYATERLAKTGTEAEWVARLAKQRGEFQDAVDKGYLAMKATIERAAKNH